jgi:hypothetical protein
VFGALERHGFPRIGSTAWCLSRGKVEAVVQRAVIATNVLVAGLRSRQGCSCNCWMALEHEDVLKRDFAGAAAHSIQVLRPIEFLQQIGALR